jgi:hypothetical protein
MSLTLSGNVFVIIGNSSGQSKVGDLDCVVIAYKNVASSKVSMDYLVFVCLAKVASLQVCHAVCYLEETQTSRDVYLAHTWPTLFQLNYG